LLVEQAALAESHAAILPHGTSLPHTTYIWGLPVGPESRNFKISPMRRANMKHQDFCFSEFNSTERNEYYNFSRIEPGGHGCFFGL